MYRAIADKLMAGQTVIIDGGTGTEIQRRGVAMDGDTWCAEANAGNPDVVRAVHEDYLAAGAEVITANTYATSPLLFNALGRDDDVAAIDLQAVRLAREAGAAVVAGSFSIMRPAIRGSDRVAQDRRWSAAEAAPLMRRKAEGLAKAGCDLILMEMMRDLDYSLWATEAAVATGLPVWVGLATERRKDGKLAGHNRHDWALEDVVSALMATGAALCAVMHSSANDTDEALDIVRARWNGPLGAYPDSGYFVMPDWRFEDIIPPQDLVAKARGWRAKGVAMLGGCCGIGPDHIKALKEAFPMKTGSCLCGAVKYEVLGALRDVIACHCSQCRKQTGTYMSATAARDGELRLTEKRGLKWYEASPEAQRGFCGECGSVLFWKGAGRDYTAIAAGSIDGKTGLKLDGHIFCDDAGDYYEIAGGHYRHGGSTP